MKEEFETLEVEVVELDWDDVITTSVTPCPNETEIGG